PSKPPTRNQIATAVRSTVGADAAFERIADVEIARVADAAVVSVRSPGSRSHVRNGTTPCAFTGGAPPTGHSFHVDIESFDLSIGGNQLRAPQTTDFELSVDPGSTLLSAGKSVTFAVVAVMTGPGLVSTQGYIVPTATAPAPAPPDSDLESAAA